MNTFKTFLLSLSLYAILGCSLAMSADGPPTDAAPVAPANQVGNGFIPCAIGFFGAKLAPHDAKGFIATLDGIKLKLTRTGDHFEMEPIGFKEPKPNDFKPPIITVGETDVTYDVGPMVVRWKMDQVVELPKDWTTAERISGKDKGPLGKSVITIKREKGAVTLTLSGPSSRPESWTVSPF